jgi:hypothetical protein
MFCAKMCHKHWHQFCLTAFLYLQLTNIATARNFCVLRSKLIVAGIMCSNGNDTHVDTEIVGQIRCSCHITYRLKRV